MTEHRSAVSMLEARLDYDPPVVVRAEDIDEAHERWPRNELICRYCDIPVVAVPSYRTETQGVHRAHFRRKQKHDHRPECLFDVDERVRALQQAADAILVRGDSADHTPEGFAHKETHVDIGAGVRVVAEQLPGLLDSAARIAALVTHYLDHRIDPYTEWRVPGSGDQVEWTDFLYVPQRIQILRRRLEHHGPLLRHPVAVMFRPRTGGAVLGRALPSGDQPTEGYRSTYPEPFEPGGPFPPEIVIEGDYDVVDRAFLPGLNRHYLGYGMWRLVGPARCPTLRLHHEAQIVPMPSDPEPGPLHG
ncbi:hypothetical protein EBN03_22610 [Nocardia stercoris]|uniref:Uncharacterized protein n=1 Tax=Nocardia stercoris TaxID=2483361 RepID=A0A3M2L648_9NOCA|nr:hypothetical protein EBN03_22610 [Nocardia stercoris]